MNSIRPIFKVAVFVFTMCGISCFRSGNVQHDSTQNVTQENPPKPIEILDSAKIDRPYEIIGFVQAKASRGGNLADTIEQLKEEARALGGDAIVDVQEGQSRKGIVVPIGNVFVVKHKNMWNAKVIKWKINKKKADSEENK